MAPRSQLSEGVGKGANGKWKKEKGERRKGDQNTLLSVCFHI